MMIARNFLSVGLFWVLMFAPAANGQQDKAAGAVEWDKLVDAAKKEAKVTVSLPASAEMKKQVEEQFKKRYGIEVETFTARGSSAVRRMADEFKAGVRSFDLHIGGSSSIVSGMLDEGILDPIEPWLASRSRMVERVDQTMTDLRAAQSVDLAMLTVASRQLRALVES